MQEDTITLDVDVLNNGTTVPRAYGRQKTLENISFFNGPEATLSTRDELMLQRKMNTRQGNSQGVYACKVRNAQNKAVPGVDTTTNVEHLIAIDTEFRIPVGVPEAEVLEFLMRHVAVLSSGVMEALANNQAI